MRATTHMMRTAGRRRSHSVSDYSTRRGRRHRRGARTVE
ncbi:unnamed protein product, partial [Ixodes pacificus]